MFMFPLTNIARKRVNNESTGTGYYFCIHQIDQQQLPGSHPLTTSQGPENEHQLSDKCGASDIHQVNSAKSKNVFSETPGRKQTHSVFEISANTAVTAYRNGEC